MNIKNFEGKKIVVLGDLIADITIEGITDRISREAPVLIVKEKKQTLTPGGAGNVVMNIKAMGGIPIPVGVVGCDVQGLELTHIFTKHGITCDHVLRDTDSFTTTKTRILAGGHNTIKQQMLRIDTLNEGTLDPHTNLGVFSFLQHALINVDALIVSDYGLGVVSNSIRDKINIIAEASDIPVFVDSRHNIHNYGFAEALIPSETDLHESKIPATHVKYDEGELIAWLLSYGFSKSVLLKRGNKGMSLFQPDKECVDVGPFGTTEVIDVTGAGDTVIAAYTLARVSGSLARGFYEAVKRSWRHPGN